MSSSTQSAGSPRFSRRVKIIIGVGIAVISILYMFACALLIDTFSQRGAPAVVGPVSPQPTPSDGGSTPATNQPRVTVSGLALSHTRAVTSTFGLFLVNAKLSTTLLSGTCALS